MKSRRAAPLSTLSDISFLLLLFFLVAAVTTMRTPVPIDPARSSGGSTDTPSRVVLFVDREGRLYHNDMEIAPSGIPEADEILLYADSHTPFSAVYPLLEACQRQGVSSLFAVVEEQEHE